MELSSDIPDIPVIDFMPFLHGSIRDREDVAASVDAGLSSTGFIYLRNHGIDPRRVAECLNWSKRFFALPESEKELIQRSPSQSQYCGYSGVGNEKVREHKCMKEGFTYGNPNDETQPNLWPSEDVLPGFGKFIEGFFEDCTKLMHHLLDCLSLALKLPSAHSLSGFHAKSLFDLDLLHYPALSTQLLRSGTFTRIPAHSDTGTLTLLFQDSIGGLEIADLASASTDKSVEFEKHGKFIHVKPIPDTVIVNVGYLLMRWSNGRWRNTIHRVVEPPSVVHGIELNESDAPGNTEVDPRIPDHISPARYSIPFFAAPDPETVVQALPGCWTEEIPKRWGPLNAGKYRQRKREGMYT